MSPHFTPPTPRSEYPDSLIPPHLDAVVFADTHWLLDLDDAALGDAARLRAHAVLATTWFNLATNQEEYPFDYDNPAEFRVWYSGEFIRIYHAEVARRRDQVQRLQRFADLAGVPGAVFISEEDVAVAALATREVGGRLLTCARCMGPAYHRDDETGERGAPYFTAYWR